MTPGAPPLLVEVLRGGRVESVHRVSYAVVDAQGKILQAAGAIDAPVFPRSAVKPIQALPLVETGTADKLGLGERELALACASHTAEPFHIEGVTEFLRRAGLTEDDLECGPQVPRDPASAQELVRLGQPPSRLHNNCSGKHAGFLATAKCLGEATRGYILFEHPVQQRVTAALGEMAGLDLFRAPRAIDGCGIPVIEIPLVALAHGFARLADPSGLPADRSAAIARILNAMAARPEMVDGTGGLTTSVLETAGATVRLKPGAEGVFCAALPTHGLGVALKAEDGAKRAADVAMTSLLDRLGCFTPEQRLALHPFLEPKIHNAAGDVVGLVRAQ